MLSSALAHAGEPLAPHDLWLAWNPEPLLLAALALSTWIYARGRAPGGRSSEPRWAATCFTAGLVTLAVAVLSPLDALSGELAAAHMVQHLLLALVAPPLLVLAAPGHRLLRGVAVPWRRRAARLQLRLGLSPGRVRALRTPALAWLLTVAALWFWHGAVPYDAAVRHEVVHAVEHASFLASGLLFWAAVLPTRSGRHAAPGYALLLLFTMATQGTLLAALLTFAETPWYDSYATTAPTWGLDALSDQQLAGVLMWVPAGLIYLGAAMAILGIWLRDTEAVSTASGQGSGATASASGAGPADCERSAASLPV